MQKRLPPFGKPLADLLASGYKPDNDVLLFMGSKAWTKGHAFSRTFPKRLLILPPYLCPTGFTWPVNQCDVLIFDSGFADVEYIEDLVFCLFQDGANIVRYCSPDHELAIYKKEF